MEANLTIFEVAKLAGCHRNTVLYYESRGYIRPFRDNNNFRRYSIHEARNHLMRKLTQHGTKRADASINREIATLRHIFS